MTQVQKLEPIDLDEDRIHTVASLAQHLDVTDDTIRLWIRTGKIPVWQPSGDKGRIFISEKALARAISESSMRKQAAPRRPALPKKRRPAEDVAPKVVEFRITERRCHKKTPSASAQDTARTGE